MQKIIEKPFIIKNFFSPEVIMEAQDHIAKVKVSPYVNFDDKEFMRKFVHNDFYCQSLHKSLVTEKIKECLDISQVKESYSFLSMYFRGQGICPKHTDRGQCKLTVDVCLDQNEPWSFFTEIDGVVEKYDLEIGDALVLSGTDHPHWRDKIQKNNFCDLVFFHYVSKDFTGDLN